MSQESFFRKYLILRIGGPFAKFAKISDIKLVSIQQDRNE